MLLDLSDMTYVGRVVGRVTSRSDAWCYVTQRTWQCDGSPQVTWTCQIWLKTERTDQLVDVRSTCQVVMYCGHAVLRKVAW